MVSNDNCGTVQQQFVVRDLARYATASLGWHRSLCVGPDLQSVDLSQHVRMDAGVLWWHGPSEFLPAAILFPRRAFGAYASSFIRCRIQDCSCCTDVAATCRYMVAFVSTLRKGSNSGNVGSAGIDAVIGRQPLHQFNERHWTQSHFDVSARSLYAVL